MIKSMVFVFEAFFSILLFLVAGKIFVANII